MDTEILRKKYILWSNIVDLRSRGINITRTAHRLGVSRDTVRHLQSLTSDELVRECQTQEGNRYKLQNYEREILSLLISFPSISNSRVHDHLEEHYPNFPKVCDKTCAITCSLSGRNTIFHSGPVVYDGTRIIIYTSLI